MKLGKERQLLCEDNLNLGRIIIIHSLINIRINLSQTMMVRSNKHLRTVISIKILIMEVRVSNSIIRIMGEVGKGNQMVGNDIQRLKNRVNMINHLHQMEALIIQII